MQVPPTCQKPNPAFQPPAQLDQLDVKGATRGDGGLDDDLHGTIAIASTGGSTSATKEAAAEVEPEVESEVEVLPVEAAASAAAEAESLRHAAAPADTRLSCSYQEQKPPPCRAALDRDY